MGLAISSLFVESYGGPLWATPSYGRGATFHFSFPTATEAAEAPRRERDLVPSGLVSVIHIDRLAGGADQKVVAPVSRATLP